MKNSYTIHNDDELRQLPPKLAAQNLADEELLPTNHSYTPGKEYLSLLLALDLIGQDAVARGDSFTSERKLAEYGLKIDKERNFVLTEQSESTIEQAYAGNWISNIGGTSESDKEFIAQRKQEQFDKATHALIDDANAAIIRRHTEEAYRQIQYTLQIEAKSRGQTTDISTEEYKAYVEQHSDMTIVNGELHLKQAVEATKTRGMDLNYKNIAANGVYADEPENGPSRQELLTSIDQLRDASDERYYTIKHELERTAAQAPETEQLQPEQKPGGTMGIAGALLANASIVTTTAALGNTGTTKDVKTNPPAPTVPAETRTPNEVPAPASAAGDKVDEPSSHPLHQLHDQALIAQLSMLAESNPQALAELMKNKDNVDRVLAIPAYQHALADAGVPVESDKIVKDDMKIGAREMLEQGFFPADVAKSALAHMEKNPELAPIKGYEQPSVMKDSELLAWATDKTNIQAKRDWLLADPKNGDRLYAIQEYRDKLNQSQLTPIQAEALAKAGLPEAGGIPEDKAKEFLRNGYDPMDMSRDPAPITRIEVRQGDKTYELTGKVRPEQDGTLVFSPHTVGGITSSGEKSGLAVDYETFPTAIVLDKNGQIPQPEKLNQAFAVADKQMDKNEEADKTWRAEHGIPPRNAETTLAAATSLQPQQPAQQPVAAVPINPALTALDHDGKSVNVISDEPNTVTQHAMRNLAEKDFTEYLKNAPKLSKEDQAATQAMLKNHDSVQATQVGAARSQEQTQGQSTP